MAQINGYSNGHHAGPAPHDLPGMAPYPQSTSNPYGANPPPGWSQYVGPEHKAKPPVATQLVVPTDLGDSPITLTCFNCQEHITTTTKTSPSKWSWATCLCLCLFVCWPCCLVPFCCPPLNVTEHICPNCKVSLGKYKPWKK